jgi:hypothetical protein
MTKIRYKRKKFKDSSIEIIAMAIIILEEYDRQGFKMTLRQLYYQMVARDYIPNKFSEYKRVGKIIADARECGLISWDAIEDRGRFMRGNTRWDDPREIIQWSHDSYKIDMWANQEYRVEVWIEKDALIGVIDRICKQLDVPFFSCRGYPSATKAWEAGYYRVRDAHKNGQEMIILHMADHDPSGIDMTRDVHERLELYSGLRLDVERIALNMDQIEEYDPPPNWAKLSDSRAGKYVRMYGHESWELDALEPPDLARIIEEQVNRYRDTEKWSILYEQWEEDRKVLKDILGGLNANR